MQVDGIVASALVVLVACARGGGGDEGRDLGAARASTTERSAAGRAQQATGMLAAGRGGGASDAGTLDANAMDRGERPDARPDAPATPPNETGVPGVSDLEARGPYASTTDRDVGPDRNYTVYRPAQLARAGSKQPIVGWMSGGATDHNLYSLLPHLATHGFVVVASNTIPGIGDEATLGQEILAGIEWAIAENGRPGSAFEGALDTTKIAAVGYSMGSLATFTIAADPRLTTTVHISGGNMAPERVDNLHAPAAFICGTPGDAWCTLIDPTCDIAGANCATDFERATTQVFYATFPGGHLGILTPPFDARIAGMTTAWLRRYLMDDRARATSFVGNHCTYCVGSDWTVRQKNLK